MKMLSSCGEAARDLLTQAMKSNDLDVRSRAGRILRVLDSGEQLQLRQSLTLAALQVLRSRRDPKATPVILSTLELLGEPYARDMAAEALWASAAAAHIDLLTVALDHEDIRVRSAVIVALEVAGGKNSTERIAPLLESKEAMIRLAAARALVDREPQRSVEALVAIAGEDAQDLAWQADALLQMKTGHRVSPGEMQTLGDAWKEWSLKEFAGARLDAQVGAKRLDLSAGRNTLDEAFARDQKSLAEGYGRFLYEATNRGPAKAADGKLRIDGNNPEGDQRLYITSQRMIGRDRWPGGLEVRAKMGGELGNNFGWHLGLSVGRVKVLFHPGLRGGGFRAETTDGHRNLFANENMSFEPVNGVMHEMILRVTKTKAGADFDVTVNGGNGGAPHQKKFSADREQLGDYDRIGLERSGRTGGAALFDSISIRLEP